MAASAFGAVYDATTGYVTILPNGGGDSSGSNAPDSMLFSSAGDLINHKFYWSDEQKPHAGTNYYLKGCIYAYGAGYYEKTASTAKKTYDAEHGTAIENFDGTFPGDSLTLASGAYLRTTDGAVSFNNLIALGGSSVNSQLGGGGTFSGRMTFDTSTSTSPFEFVGGKGGATYTIAMALVGGEETAFIAHADKYGASHTGGPMKTLLKGDNSAFSGTARVGANMVLQVASDLANAKVSVEATNATFQTTAASGATVAVKSLAVTAGRVALSSVNTISADAVDFADGAVLDCSGLSGKTATVGAALVVGTSWTQRGKVIVDISGLTAGFGANPVDLLVIPTAAGEVNAALVEVRPQKGAFPCTWVTEGGATKLRMRSALLDVFDETTGYVRLTQSDLDAKVHEQWHSFTNALCWSDGKEPHSNPPTNYYAGVGLGSEAVTFGGTSLTLGANVPVRLNGGTTTINDFRVLSGARLDQYLNPASQKLCGQMTLFTDTSNPLFLWTGQKNASIDLAMTLVGEASTAIRAEGGYDGKGRQTDAYTDVYFTGDTTRFFGSVAVGFEVTAHLGDFGFPNSPVTVDDAKGAVEAKGASGRTIPVKSLTMAAGKVKLNALNCLATEELDLADGAVLDCSDLGKDIATVGAALVVGKKWTQRGAVVIDLSKAKPTFGPNPVDLLVVSNAAGTVDTDLIEVGPERSTYAYEWVRDADVTALRIVSFDSGVYDASTGFVTLRSNDAKSYDTASTWSDDQPPHPGTNYYGGNCAMTFKATKFQGDCLVMNGASPRVDGISGWSPAAPNNICEIEDFRILGNGLRFEMCGSGATRRIAGNWRVMTNEGKCLDIEETSFVDATDNWKGSTVIWIFDANFFGDETATIKGGNPDKQYNHDYVADGDKWIERAPEVWLLGDMSNYLGSYHMTLNAVLRLGDTGLPGALYADKARTRLTTMASDGATVRVGSYTTALAATVDVPPTNALAVGSVNLTGTLTKVGAGAFAIGGTAVAGAGAAIAVAEGGLKPLSATCVSGVPVSFASGAGIVLDWTPADADVVAKGLNLADAAVTLHGTLKVKFDLNGVTPERGVYRRNLLTVKDADAALVAGKIAVTRPFAGVRVTKIGSASENGLTTFYADIEPTGVLLLVR